MKLVKLQKFVKNHINLRKMQSKFLWNPLEQIYAVGLTKSLFVHYCSIENSKKSNLEIINYKISCNIKS
jgi:hypothetical protein